MVYLPWVCNHSGRQKPIRDASLREHAKLSEAQTGMGNVRQMRGCTDTRMKSPCQCALHAVMSSKACSGLTGLGESVESSRKGKLVGHKPPVVRGILWWLSDSTSPVAFGSPAFLRIHN